MQVVAFFVAIAMLGCLGCQSGNSQFRSDKVLYGDTSYADQPTPPGEIKSAPPAAAPVAPYRPDATTGARRDIARAQEARAEAVRQFRKAYQGSKQPRIAVYLNRALSDDVKEWTSNERLAVGFGETSVKDTGKSKEITTASGAITTSVETRTPTGEGVARPETWMWRLEESFVGQLNEAGVRLVDRAMINRLAAADAQVSAYGDPPSKQIEIAALKGKADILAEIEISQQPSARYGYVFRTRAVDVNTGELLVSTTSAGWVLQPPGEIIDTNSGPVETTLPEPEVVGAMLATDIMAKLCKRI